MSGKVMDRKLAGRPAKATANADLRRWATPRVVLETTIDIGALELPPRVRLLFAEAFWNQYQHEIHRAQIARWWRLKCFERFVKETGAVEGVEDLCSAMLRQYIEWLNRQLRADGRPWAKGYRSSNYSTLKAMVKWIQRCHPESVGAIDYPFSPFPHRNRDRTRRPSMAPAALRALLRACEKDIRRLREVRAEGLAARRDAEPGSLGRFLESIDRTCGGVLPDSSELQRSGRHAMRVAVQKHGGARTVERYLYPQVDTLLPYYLAILLHTAGNPEPILDLRTDCLRPLPLLDDRELVVWMKKRAGKEQRRAFDRGRSFEPPVLIREVVEWTARLRDAAPADVADRLFLFKFGSRINALSITSYRNVIGDFCKRHGLPRFAPTSIRVGALTSFYRATGDLKKTSAIANHSGLSTTASYVRSAEVHDLHQARIASLQSAFIGHIEKELSAGDREVESGQVQQLIPDGEAISMFGFGCRDPLEGVAPGSVKGQLCGSYLGCFTCPNAVIVGDLRTVARLLQAQDHLRAAAQSVHPARWQAIYAPPLRVLESDILPRFTQAERLQARELVASLPPLPDLR